jgi:hypothetical protein
MSILVCVLGRGAAARATLTVLRATVILHALVHFGAPSIRKFTTLFRRRVAHLLVERCALFRRHAVCAMLSTSFTVPAHLTPLGVGFHAVLHAMAAILHAALHMPAHSASFTGVRISTCCEHECQRDRYSCCKLPFAAHDGFLSV